MKTNTVKLHRVIKAAPEKIYRAFFDPEALVKWFPPHGFTCKVTHLDPRVGGKYQMSFTNFTTGKIHSFSGEYVELVPNEYICLTDRFDDPGFPGILKTTITIKPVTCGSELNIIQEGIPEVIPVDGCYIGWQETLQLLAQLVEPEISE